MTFELNGKIYESKPVRMAQIVQDEVYSKKFGEAFNKFLADGNEDDLFRADEFWTKKVSLYVEGDATDFSLFKLPIQDGILDKIQAFFFSVLEETLKGQPKQQEPSNDLSQVTKTTSEVKTRQKVTR